MAGGFMAIAFLKHRGRTGRGEGRECWPGNTCLPAAAACLLLFVGANRVLAQEPKVELLWPKGAPDAKGETPNDKPTLTILPAPADKANGAAVVICPGGGYGAVMMTYEGVDVGRWLNTLGVSTFVLNYRHAARAYQHPVPLEDAQRAIRTLRAR